MKKPSLQEIFSIPNLLTYFRFLLIPLFIWAYLNAENARGYHWAALVLVVSALTDLFDGKIARHFHMITELGILLDPIADKLTEGAVLLCLMLRWPWMAALVVVYVLKEGFMAVAGAVMLRRGKKLGGAMWFGKVCTAVFYVITLLLTFWMGIPVWLGNTLIFVCGGMMLFTLIRYAVLYFNMAQSSHVGTFETLQSVKQK